MECKRFQRRRRATRPSPTSSESPKSTTGRVPDQNSPVCTVVAPGTVAVTGAGGAVVGVAAAVTAGTAPVTLVVAAPRTIFSPPSVPVAPAPALGRASMLIPVADAEPLPEPGVAEPDPTATVVSRGVPARKVWDWPGAIETVWVLPTGGSTVALTAAGESEAVTCPVDRSRAVVALDGPTVTVRSGPPPAPRPSSRLSWDPLSWVVAVAVLAVAVTVDVDDPRLAVTSEVSCAFAAFATSWRTVASEVPPVGSDGSAPSTLWRPLATVLPGSTGRGRALVEGLTPMVVT
jgi:hypothetical protein